MAIFNKSDQQTDHASNITTIAAGSSFTGKVEIECSLHIDGEFNGDIQSSNIVTVGQSGVVNCELKAQKLTVAGKFFGNATCEEIELLTGGEVEGQLTAASLAIDSGASFHGESIRKKPGDNAAVVDFATESAQFRDKSDGKASN